jgi:hypothetical protein
MFKLELKLSTRGHKASLLSGWLNDAPAVKAEPVVAHPGITAGEYVLKETFHIEYSKSDIWSKFGQEVLLFQSTGRAQRVYLTKGPVADVRRNHITVPVKLFNFLLGNAKRAKGFSLTVTRPWFQFGMPAVQATFANLDLDLIEFKGNPEAPRRAAKPAQEAHPVSSSQMARAPARVEKPVAAKPKSPMRYRRNYSDYDDGATDFMFMSGFPGSGPLYRPGAMMAWHTWWQDRDGEFAGAGASGSWSHEGEIPGFPEGRSQQVTPCADGNQVEIRDGAGRCLASFVVAENRGQTQITTDEGSRFELTSRGTSDLPSLEYFSESRSFRTSPDVGGLWSDTTIMAPRVSESRSSADESFTNTVEQVQQNEATGGMDASTAY